MPVNVAIHPPQRNTKDSFLIKNPLHLQGYFVSSTHESITVQNCLSKIVYSLIIVMAKPTPEQLAAALRQNLRRRKKGEGATSSASPTTPASTDQTSPSQQRRS